VSLHLSDLSPAPGWLVRTLGWTAFLGKEAMERPIHVCFLGGDFKPGDMPPKGYSDWHTWAEVQYKAGLRQKQAPCCGRWFFPQEFNDHLHGNENG